MNDPLDVRAELLVLFMTVGLGTYLMRAVPLLAALRRLDAPESRRPGARTSRLMFALRLVAPAVIAALLATSVLPARSVPNFWRQLAVSLAALAFTAWVAARWRHLGLTVLVGVACFWGLTLLL